MDFKIDSIYDIGRFYGVKEGERKTLREMLKDCITLPFPRIAQATIDSIMSITDYNVLKSIFKVACTAESLDNFQRDIRGMAPVN